MAGNPKTSKWFAISQGVRVRKKVQITLSDEARVKLKRLKDAHELGTQSAVVEDLILAAAEPTDS